MTQLDPTALGLCITFPVLAIASTIARLYTKTSKKTGLGLGDWLIVIATILSTGNAANVLYGAIAANLGQHVPTDRNGLAQLGPKITSLEIMTYVTQPVVTVTIGLARWSILLFYARLFTVQSFKIPLWIMYALNGAWTVAFTLAYLMQCIPVQHLWTQQQGARTGCIDISVNLYYAVSSVLLDVFVLCMPWPMIWRLQMPTARKVGVLAILMLGAIIVAVSIGKAYTFFNIERILRAHHDVTYDEAPLFYWTVPECCLSVVCANLPTLRPLFSGFSPESVIGSLRSIFSLRSSSSSTLHRRGEKSFTTQENGSKTNSSRSRETFSLKERPSLTNPTEVKVKTAISVTSEPKVGSAF